MKKLALLGVVAVAAVGAALVGTALASGGSTSYQVGCNVLDANGGGVSTTGTVTVYSSGKVTLHCIGQGAGNGSVVIWNFGNTGFSCNVDIYPSTTNWNDRVSKSGESQLWCYTSTGDAAPSSPSGVGT